MKIRTHNCNRLDCIDTTCQSEGIILPLQKCVTHHATRISNTCLSTYHFWTLFRFFFFLKNTDFVAWFWSSLKWVCHAHIVVAILTLLLLPTVVAVDPSCYIWTVSSSFKFVSIAVIEVKESFSVVLEQLKNNLNCCLNFRFYGLWFKNTVLDVSFW